MGNVGKIPDSRFPIPVPLLGGVRGGFRFPIPDSRLPIPDYRFPFPSWEGLGVGSDSRFPITDSRFPIPDSRFPENPRLHPCYEKDISIYVIFRLNSPGDKHYTCL
ncbi:hypothetical protein [Moorena producens]|uniref:hypothetical protein n=1 Tax=Moorena producens TaxID=1155739 RepID=UPI003C71D738